MTGVLAVVLVFGNRVILRPGDYMNQTLNYFGVQHTEKCVWRLLAKDTLYTHESSQIHSFAASGP